MKTLFGTSIAIMLLAVILMTVSFLVHPFEDWAVRLLGIIMLLDIPVVAYSTVKLSKAKK